MRRHSLVICLMTVVVGCGQSMTAGSGDDTGSGSDQPPPDPKGWTITIDASGANRFVDPLDSATWPLAGTLTSTNPVASFAVGGAPVTVGTGGGAFTTDVPVAAGLTRVTMLATDDHGNTRQGARTFLAARMLPDAQLNPDAASLVLDNATLQAMAGGLDAGTIDVAGEIMQKQYLSQDDQCATWPVAAQQGAVQLALAQTSGTLGLTITVPDLDVQFEGVCQGLIQQIPIAGEMSGTLVIHTTLGAKPTAGDCLHAFSHTAPTVEVDQWGFDVWGTGGPLQNWIIELFSGSKSQQAEAQLQTEVGAKADDTLATKLGNIAVFDKTNTVSMLGEDVDMHLCVTDLKKSGSKLIAKVAASTTSAGTLDAPGAPQIDGAAPAPAAKELVLDANLVGQLLYASWRAGGLHRPGPDVDAALLEILMPELATKYPGVTAVKVAIDAELPPVVHATPDGPGNLSVEMGDVMLDLTMNGDRVFRFDVGLTLALDLKPVDGKLSPTVVGSTAVVTLVDELYDGPDDALEQAVQLKIGDAITSLLGDNAAIALPDLPGLGAPTKVTADKNGRFLHVTLQ